MIDIDVVPVLLSLYVASAEETGFTVWGTWYIPGINPLSFLLSITCVSLLILSSLDNVSTGVQDTQVLQYSTRYTHFFIVLFSFLHCLYPVDSIDSIIAT